MKKLKKENVIVHILFNFVIFTLIAIMIVFSAGAGKKRTLATSNSEYRGTIYAGDKSSKKVSLMINVYWGTEYLKQMLETLEKHGIKTTFFVGGTWVKEEPELLKQMKASGHEIASHGYNHKEHGKLDYLGNYTEIEKCHKAVKEVIDKNMELFAPPGGSYNAQTIEAATALGYKTIMWTRDTIDWRDKNANLIYNRAVTGMQGGDLILMHPTEKTAEALGKIIEYAKNHGFTLTTVSDTLALV